MTRYYSLESAGNLAAPAWSGVTGAVNIPGNDQLVTYAATATGSAFYRAALSLAPSPANVSDTNGLPDAWEVSWFGSAGQDPDADPDSDGMTTAAEYLAGTDPTNSADAFRLSIARNGGAAQVSFLARQAEGAGYEGRTRLYTLQTTAGASLTAWTNVSGVVNVVGTNQIVLRQIVPTNASSFFRAQVQLQGP
jgi:hypothetical protein